MTPKFGASIIVAGKLAIKAFENYNAMVSYLFSFQVNNLTHFSKIIENPNVSEEDVTYDEDGSEARDNPVMIAAKLRHKELVSSVLR